MILGKVTMIAQNPEAEVHKVDLICTSTSDYAVLYKRRATDTGSGLPADLRTIIPQDLAKVWASLDIGDYDIG